MTYFDPFYICMVLVIQHSCTIWFKSIKFFFSLKKLYNENCSIQNTPARKLKIVKYRG